MWVHFGLILFSNINSLYSQIQNDTNSFNSNWDKNDTRLPEHHYSEVGRISDCPKSSFKFIISSLPNRIKTSFYSFSYHIVFHSLKVSFVRCDSGRTTTEDRGSSLRINYWAPMVISSMYDFWECLGQS